MNKRIDSGATPPFSSFSIDPLEFRVLQIREQHPREIGGKSRGFTLEGSETILEMQDSHPEVVEKIKDRLFAIMKRYREGGVISDEEFSEAFAPTRASRGGRKIKTTPKLLSRAAGAKARSVVAEKRR